MESFLCPCSCPASFLVTHTAKCMHSAELHGKWHKHWRRGHTVSDARWPLFLNWWSVFTAYVVVLIFWHKLMLILQPAILCEQFDISCLRAPPSPVILTGWNTNGHNLPFRNAPASLPIEGSLVVLHRALYAAKTY